MNRKPARAILFIFLFILIAGGGLYSYFRWFRNGSKDLDLETIFAVVDQDISKGYYTEADDTLSACKKFSGNSTVWFRILRRAEAISRALGDFSYLSEYAEAAVEDLPGNEELWAVRVYALLREEKYARAFSEGEKYLEEERYQPLIAEAALNLGPERVDSKKVEENQYWRMFMTGGERAPQTYEEYARETQDDRIFAAAAIAWMIEGDTGRAVENCTQIQGSEYDLLKVFIYYDAGKYSEALELLEALQDAGNVGGVEGNFLQADILMALEKYQNAEDVYERIIRDAPESSWIPYLNIVWIKTTKKGEIADAAEYILKAFELFPQKEEVEIALSLFLIQFGRRGKGEELLGDISAKLEEMEADVSRRPDLSDQQRAERINEIEEIRYLVNRSMNLSRSPEQYKTLLWQLFNQSERNVKIAQFFSWYLLGLHDYENLQTVLEKSERKFGEMEWIDFFYGTMYAVRGKSDMAKTRYEKAAEKMKRWETYYNLALLALQQGDHDLANDYFLMAEDKIKTAEDTVTDRQGYAQIRVKMAQIQMADQRYDIAKKTVLEALEYDSDNLEAQLLKKKLEAGIER
jgi:tetratricopeptide (TPR) repeat protein